MIILTIWTSNTCNGPYAQHEQGILQNFENERDIHHGALIVMERNILMTREQYDIGH